MCPSLAPPCAAEIAPQIEDISQELFAKYATKLLETLRLRDLGRFAAHVRFDLQTWLANDGRTAATVRDFQQALVQLHEQFAWPIPSLDAAVADDARLSGIAALVAADESAPSSPIAPPFQDSADKTDLDPIKEEAISQAHLQAEAEMRLVGGREGGERTRDRCLACLRDSTRSSDLCSMLHPRYLLNIMADARCFDWAFLLAVVLQDAPAVEYSQFGEGGSSCMFPKSY